MLQKPEVFRDKAPRVPPQSSTASPWQLVVNDRPDHNGVHGFLTGIKSQHRLEEKTFAEWHMLVFLAGKMGEARTMGESTIGSTNDHARWVNMARQYLSNPN